MEELKNIRHYNEFKESLNEELLWAAIKNLFSKVFGNMDKKLAASISEFTKRLDGSKSWAESVKIYEEFTKKDQAGMTETLKTVYGPLGLRKVLYDNASRVFLELQELSNKYQTPELQAKKIFADKEGEKDMFNYDNSEAFTGAAMEACNAKILEMNTSTKAYPDQAALETYLKANTDIKAVQTVAAKPAEQPAPKNPPAEQTPDSTKPAPVTGTGGNTGVPGNANASIYFNLNDYEKINEQDQKVAPIQTPAEQKPVASPGVNGTPPQGSIEALKVPATAWLTNNLYGVSSEKVKTIKPAIATALAGNKDPFTSIATGSKATANKENLAKLLRNIVNIPDTQTLAKVRNEIGRIQGKDPKDFETEIGKF